MKTKIKISLLMIIFGILLISASKNVTSILKNYMVKSISNKKIQCKINNMTPSNNASTNFSNITYKSYTSSKATKQETSIKKINGFVNVKDIDDTLIIDLKYAKKDNFIGEVLYNFNICILRENTAIKIKNVNTQLKKNGYRLKIYDGYRPLYVQKIMWQKTPDKRYVANPYKKGSVHNKGCAVDVTIVDKNGKEIEMPSKFDEFSIKASRKNPNMTQNAKKNLELLTKVMAENGFTYISSEWWHFEDVDKNKYEIIDIDPNIFK